MLLCIFLKHSLVGLMICIHLWGQHLGEPRPPPPFITYLRKFKDLIEWKVNKPTSTDNWGLAAFYADFFWFYFCLFLLQGVMQYAFIYWHIILNHSNCIKNTFHIEWCKKNNPKSIFLVFRFSSLLSNNNQWMFLFVLKEKCDL